MFGIIAWLVLTAQTTILLVLGLLAATSIVTFFVILTRAPIGYQDVKGFHYGIPVKGHLTDEDTRYADENDRPKL
jgi:hypothetical protein